MSDEKAGRWLRRDWDSKLVRTDMMLPEDMYQAVKALADSGEYNSMSAVLRDALRLFLAAREFLRVRSDRR